MQKPTDVASSKTNTEMKDTEGERMNAKEYLMQVRMLDNKIKNLDEEIRDIRSEIITVRSSWPDGQPHGTGISNPVESAIEKLMDQLQTLEHQMMSMQSQMWRTRNEIIETIGKVTQAEYNRLLYLRYVQGKMWEQIAVDMGYTYQWVAGPLHSNALQEIDEILKEG